jgi:hypothetical protein
METPVIPAHLEAQIERSFQHFSRFADADAMKIPGRLRKPITQKAWRALPVEDRLKHLRATVAGQVVEEHEAKAAVRAKAKAAALTAPEPEPAPVAEATPARSAALATRYVVACVAGCGTFHPASSARPVVVTCGDREQTAKSRKRSIYDAFSEERAEYLIAALRHEAEAARDEAAAPRPKAKTRKRRRAVCVNTKG